MKPFYNKVLVKAEKTPEKYGNLVIPDAARQLSNVGEVLEVGPTSRPELKIKKGDKVIFRKGGDMLPWGEDMFFINVYAVYATV